MSELPVPKIQKWPYLAAAVLLLAVAGHVAYRSPTPFHTVTLLVWVGAVVLAGVALVLPYRLEYRGLARLAETDLLSSAVQQLQSLESVARHVTAATAQWHGVQEQAALTQKTVRELTERMGAEARAFIEGLQRGNDGEKATLRLEVEKLRRVEGEWLQVVVGLLDHGYALHQAAAQSGRPDVAQQLSVFLNACRDIARRVGVTQLESKAGESFDDNLHRLPQSGMEAPAGAVVEAVLAPGVAFQGRLLRPAIVLAKAPAAEGGPVTLPLPESETTAAPQPEAPATEGEAEAGDRLL
jgi:molecular chaperone GrpE (heat shock protein)